MNPLVSILAVFLPLTFQGGLYFRNFSVEQGLSNNTVSSLCQDRDGMMWLATKGGVNRFDGYDTKVFRCDPEDSCSIQSNLVNSVYADTLGTIWACTADGLACYDPFSESFRRVLIPSVHSIESMIMAAAGKYLLTTRNTTILYDSEERSCSEFTLDGIPVLLYSSAVLEDCIVLGTTRSKLEFVRYRDGVGFERISPSVKLPSQAKCVLAGRDSCVWIGTKKGLLHYRRPDGDITQISLPSLPAEQITDLEYDSSGNIWVGTKYGICIYDPSTGLDRPVENDPFDISEPSDKGVRDIFRDRQGNMWVSYSNKGLDFINVNPQPFRVMRHCPGKKSITGDNIRSLAVDDKGFLWIGTRYNGLDCYSLSTGELKVYEGIPHILCMLCAREGKDLIYVGAYGDGAPSSKFEDGIIEVNRRTGKMRRISEKKDVNGFAWARDGLIWVACLSGLYLLDPNDGSSRKMPLTGDGSLIRVMTVMVDRAGHLWVGAKESLNEYEVGENHELRKITSPSLENVVRAQVLHEGFDGSVWIGTSDGLFRYHDDSLESIGSDGSLRDRFITSIQSGDDSLLWVGTDRGLCRFDPESGEEKFYDSPTGLQYSQFNMNATCKTADGTIYMGSTCGVVYFNPSDIKENTATVKPRISGIMVHNREVLPLDESGILSGSIDLTRHIVLRHDQDAITFRFSCTDYVSEGRNTFEYRLDPFDHEWTKAPAREATYTNLGKGKYTLRVRAANSDGVMAEEEALLGITVRPVWYRSTLAEIFFALSLLFGVAYIVIRLLQNARRKNESLLENMRIKYRTDMLKTRLSSYLAEDCIPSAEEEAFLTKVISRIEDMVSNQSLSVETLSRDMCMSRSNLHLKISNLTGSSAIELIKRIRIEKACDLIRNTDLPLGEIAEKSGFNSSSYFSSCFHRAMGMSPGTFLTKVRK